ncbi:Fungalysin metallopeptidase-domain-containing protein [Gorgonomyces haynaldii]|nr:Fungalysin metallopeptidase-domain-containing protein [Gorgonomyces haynaldii]
MLSLALASALLHNVQAAPAAGQHELQYVKRGDTFVPFYYPESTVAEGTSSFAASDLSESGIAQAAIDAVVAQTSVNADELKVTGQFTDSQGVTHVYVDRFLNGVAVSNHNAAVHFKDGQVASLSASFGGNNLKAPTVIDQVSVTLDKAAAIAKAQFNAPKDEHPATLEYIEIPGDKIIKAHVFQVRDDANAIWKQVSVDAASGQVVRVVDYINSATYRAIEFPRNKPTDGFSDAVNPEDKTASPNGWTTGSVTTGNNVDVFIDNGSTRGKGTNGVFTSAWSATQEPNQGGNVQAAAVNLFYLINKMHDITYHFGFTEAAGNFQNDNFGKGGSQGDSVKGNAQSSAGTNNANFGTPPDGQRPTMNMFLFTSTTPKRDGSLENDIPIHEYTHGISNRLTGGKRNGQCLGSTESGGMGEGWGDAMAMFLLRKPTDTRNTDFAMGNYVTGQPESGKGIRRFRYSTSLTTNPETFSFFSKSTEVHNLGEIWASMLNEVYWNLVDKLGFSENWYDEKQQKGNIVAMQLMIGGMMLQPCNPTFTQARDAILKADQTYYGGNFKCDIWKGFAKRGLGVDAVQSSHKDGFSVPSECSGSQPTKPVSTAVPTATRSATRTATRVTSTETPASTRVPISTGVPRPTTGVPRPTSAVPRPTTTKTVPRPTKTATPTRTPTGPRCSADNICCWFFGFDC